MLIAEKVLGPGKRHLIHYDNPQQIRDEMERVMPMYRGVARLRMGGTRSSTVAACCVQTDIVPR